MLQAKGLDSIRINVADSDKWFKEFGDDEEFSTLPAIQSGVLTVVYDEIKGYIIFSTEFKEESYEMNAEIFIGDDIDSIHMWDCSLKCEIPYVTKKKIEYSISYFEDATTSIYEKQKRTEKEIESYVNSVVLDASRPIGLFAKTMCYINWLMQHPEYKQIDKKERKNSNSSDRKKNNKTAGDAKESRTGKTHMVKINNIRFVTKENKVATGLKSQKKRFSLGSWGVRGHFRHYRNGKVVYIKPYTKGKGQKKETKEYTV